jgi:hypothetical protein
MALGLSVGGGDGGSFSQICKYNAKAGRMYRIDRKQSPSGSYENEEVEITIGFQAVMDLEGIKVGWAAFRAGMAPDFRLVPLGAAMPARPEGVNDKGKPLYNQCFRLMMKLGKSIGGDVRELASSASCVISAVDELHTQYVKERGDHRGELPVVSMESTRRIPGKGGDNSYAPVFKIVRWVDAPADLLASTAGQPAPANEPKPEPVQQVRTVSQVKEEPVPITSGEEF